MISAKESFTKEELFDQYVQYYDGLIALGYFARFGQNTFSVDATDEGVSSYLRERMLNGATYKGFGLSTQSMSSEGIAYLRVVINVSKYVNRFRRHWVWHSSSILCLITDHALEGPNLAEISNTGIFVRKSNTKLVEKHDFSCKVTAFMSCSYRAEDKFTFFETFITTRRFF